MMLKQRVRSYKSRRCSKLWIWSSCNRSAYVLFAKPGSRFVKALWTPSIKSIRDVRCGDQIWGAYSTRGRTYVLKALIKFLISREMKQRWIREARCFARLTMSEMCVLNFKSGSNNTPRSVVREALSIGIPDMKKLRMGSELPRWRMLHLECEIVSCHLVDHW